LTRTDKQSTQKILDLLSNHREYAQTPMEKEAHLSNKTVIQSLRTLKKRGLIINRSEHSKLGGKDKKIWRLTYKGLFLVLSNNLNDALKIEKILAKHSEMLLFAQKLDMFQAIGVKAPVIDAFRAVLIEMNRTFFIDQIGINEPYPPDEEIQIMFDEAIFQTLLIKELGPGKMGPFLTECKKDERLSNFYSHTFKTKAKQYENWLVLKRVWEEINISS
jgi:DNA-binding PadR family transcriptional regulator